MISRNLRVSRKDFDLIFKKGSTLSGAFFYIKKEKTPEKKGFSVVVSKKVQSGAVRRNVLKRRVKSILMKYSESFSPNTSCIVFLKKEAITADFKNLEDDLIDLLKRAGIYNI